LGNSGKYRIAHTVIDATGHNSGKDLVVISGKMNIDVQALLRKETFLLRDIEREIEQEFGLTKLRQTNFFQRSGVRGGKS
jgi:hypothetical protein